MSKGLGNKRGRGRGRRNGGGRGNKAFESSGPTEKVRGTPAQIYDKYQNLAREARADSDRVAAESYLQHAEHYFRLMQEAADKTNQSKPNHNKQAKHEKEAPAGKAADKTETVRAGKAKKTADGAPQPESGGNGARKSGAAGKNDKSRKSAKGRPSAKPQGPDSERAA